MDTLMSFTHEQFTHHFISYFVKLFIIILFSESSAFVHPLRKPMCTAKKKPQEATKKKDHAYSI